MDLRAPEIYVVRGGRRIVVVVDGRLCWRGLGVRVRRLLLRRRLRGGTVIDRFWRPRRLGGSTGALLQRAHAVAWRFWGERCCRCTDVVRGGRLLVVVDGRLCWRGLAVRVRRLLQRCSKKFICCGLSPVKGRCVRRQVIAYITKEVGSSSSRFRFVRQYIWTAPRGLLIVRPGAMQGFDC